MKAIKVVVGIMCAVLLSSCGTYVTLPDGASVKTYADAPQGQMKLESGGSSFVMDNFEHSEHTKVSGEAVVGGIKEAVKPQIYRAVTGGITDVAKDGLGLIGDIN